MAKLPSVSTITTGYTSAQALNDNFEALRDAFDNTLSRDGSTPNTLLTDIDMNSNDILNAGKIMVGGEDYLALSLQYKNSASTSASNAQTSADAALAALDNFDDRYLGQKASDPTTDNDGDALLAGALYFNTTDDVMRVYNSQAEWRAISSDGYEIVVDSSQTPSEVGISITKQLRALSDSIKDADGDTAPFRNLIIRSHDYHSPINLGSRVQIEEPLNNCNIVVVSPLVITDGGAFRVRGKEDEYYLGFDGTTEGADSIPQLRSDAYADSGTGNLRLPMEYLNDDPLQTGRSDSFSVGDLIVIRGILDPLTGSSLIKMFAKISVIDTSANEVVLDRPASLLTDDGDVDRINEISNLTVALGDPMPFNKDFFEPDGVTQLVNPYSGGVMRTRTQKIRGSTATANTAAGAEYVTVGDASVFTKGDMVYIMDDRSEDDLISPDSVGFDYPMNRTTSLVVDVDTTLNRVYIDRPLHTELDTAYLGRVMRVRPAKNISLEITSATYGAEQDIEFRNFYLGQLDFALNSSVKIGRVEGYDRRRAAAIRISSSMHCRAHNSTIFGATDQDTGGIGYGVMLYYSSNCSIYGNYISGQRHAILVQNSAYNRIYDNYCTDDYISAIDIHGTGSFGNSIYGNQIAAITRNENGPADNRSGIKVGNQSHPITDEFTLIHGNQIVGYTDTDNDGAGIDIIPPAKNVMVYGNHIIDCYYGVQMGANSSSRVDFDLDASRCVISGNTIMGATMPVKFRSSTPLLNTYSATDVIIKNNMFYECAGPAEVDGVSYVFVENNTHMSALGAFDGNYVTVTNATTSVQPSPSKLLSPTGWGAAIESDGTSLNVSQSLVLGDAETISLGDGGDLVLSHDGSSSTITHGGSGTFSIDATNDTLNILSSADEVVRVTSSDGNSFIGFEDSDTTTTPMVGADNNDLIFDVGGDRIGRIRGDKIFLFGTGSSTSPDASTSQSNLAIRESGQLRIGVASDSVAKLNRQGSSGRILEIDQDASYLGGFRSSSGNLILEFEPNGGVRFDSSIVSATSESETLDHFERGRKSVTATPETSGTISLSGDDLYVSRVGRAVMLSGKITVSAVSSPVGGYINIGTLPITCGSYSNDPAAAGGGALYWNGASYSVVPYRIEEGSDEIRVFVDASTITSGDTISLSIIYHT